MLLKNIIRSIMKKKIQWIGLISLIFLTTLLYVVLSVSSTILGDGVKDYMKDHNVESFMFTPTGEGSEADLNTLAQKYGFTYEKRMEKRIDFSNDQKNYTLMAVVPNERIATPYLQVGRLPEAEDEITLEKRFAEVNNIGLDGTYVLQDKTFKVVGFAYVSDYLYPLFNTSELVYDYKTQSVAYMKEEAFNNLTGKESAFYLGVFERTLTEEQKSQMTDDLAFGSLTFADNAMRISGATLKINSAAQMGNVFLGFILILTAFLLVLITRKQLNLERKQIGILKALGYHSHSIAQGYFIYGAGVALIGSILGVILGLVAYPAMLNLYLDFYNIPYNTDVISYFFYFALAIGITLIMGLITYVFAWEISRKNPLELMHQREDLRVTFFSRFVHKATARMSFAHRFKYNTASRSFSRIIGVFMGVFSAGLLITFFFIGSSMVNVLAQQGIPGAQYNQETIFVKFLTPEELPLKDGEEGHLVLKQKLVSSQRGDKVENFNSPNQSNSEEQSIYGLPKEGQLLNLKDEQGNSLNHLLSEGLVITKNLSLSYGLQVGDQITFTTTSIDNKEKKEVTLPVKGIYNNYLSQTIYYDADSLNLLLGHSEKSFNGAFTKGEDSFKDNPLVYITMDRTSNANIANYMSLANQIMYSIVGVAAFIAFIVIFIVSNLIVDENKKVISLLKVIGYRNKEIGRMLLNVYTPIVIVAYVLSVVAGYFLMGALLIYVAQNLGLAFPTTLAPWQVILGFVFTYLVYLLALESSKRKLRKISLSESLKEYE